VPDARVLPPELDPAEQVAARESVRLAFVAALQHLPARQRATLILRDVLRWSAAEVAELLDASVPGVNSALQRARTTLAERGVNADLTRRVDGDQRALLARYVQAFERFDLDALTALLHLDVTLSMPPYATWLRGPAAFGQYRPGGQPWALQVIDVTDGRITGINSFLDTARLFPHFGLPPRAEA
jgi:RNA polymerase sigma-70 factor (ECF subfamily)